MEFGIPSISVNQSLFQVSLTPTTSPAGNAQGGYTVILSNKNAGSVVGSGVAAGSGTVPLVLGEENYNNCSNRSWTNILIYS